MKSVIFAAAMVAIAAPTVPALAASPKAQKEYRKDIKKAQKEYRKDMRKADNPREVRQARREYQRNVQKANRDWRTYRNYDWNRPERGQKRYYADRYYRSGNYQTRRLGYNDRIYRGENGRYYCRRSDGTTGLIIGGIAGGILGNVIAPGDSKTIGTILGAGAGGLLGNAIDRNNVSCR